MVSIPDSKLTHASGYIMFQVLGKIWSIAFQYHFSMPPYYVLVLRSLASLEGQFVPIIVVCITTDYEKYAMTVTNDWLKKNIEFLIIMLTSL